MDIASGVLDKIKNAVFVIDSNYIIQYASHAVTRITNAEPSSSIGKLCYAEFIDRKSPCSGCPVANGGNAHLCHDVICKDGSRLFFDATIQEDKGLFYESLCDITELKKSSDANHFKLKELKSIQVAKALKTGDVQSKYNFLNNVMNSMTNGLLVADKNYKISFANDTLKHQLGVDNFPTACYSVYGRSEPCTDCPFIKEGVLKSQRMMGGRNVTVEFGHYHEYLVENIRDTTREIQLISEIQAFQREIEEKQRQMQLLNKDLLRMNSQLKVAQKVINEELKQVGRLQQSLLPEKLPEIEGYEFGAFYIPAEHAGGDYYDCIQMSNNHWGFTVADVSGHGTPAAVIMAMSRAIMRSYTYDVLSSGEALYMVNEILCDNVHTKDFVTMFHIVLNANNSEFNFSSAGHNPMLVFDKSEMMVRSVTTKGIFLAVFSGVDYEQKEMRLDDGDILFLYTDGLVEAMNRDREQYGLDRVISRLIMYHDVDCQQMIDELMRDVREFNENSPFEDDVTILMIKKMPTVAEAPVEAKHKH